MCVRRYEDADVDCVRYKRVFSVGSHGITTYNPTTLEVTNQWPYGDICGIAPVGKGQGTEFNLTFRKGSGKKSETLKFSTEHRTELLTEALRFRTDFSEGKITGRRYNCYKHHWSDTRKSVVLEVTPGGIDQIDPSTNRIHCSYDYRNIEGFAEVSDYQGGFCILYGGFSRLHLFASEQRDDIIKSAIEHAGNYIGITLRTRKDPIEFEQYVNHRLGKYSTDDSITSLAEFVVQKLSPRHSEPVKRILALTETCLVERDPASYNIVTLKPFEEIFSLVCDVANPQLFTVEFIRGQIRNYSSTERDSLMASLLDGVRASGNRDVCVKMTPTHKRQRWGLLSMPVDEEVESLHLKFLAAPPSKSAIAPMHDDYDLRQEQLNKASLLSSKKFLENLLEKFNIHVDHGTGALVISSLLDFLTFALCAPYSETTEGQQFDMLLEMVASNGRTLFKLFQHPSMAIVKGAGLVMKAIIEEGDKEIATKMQDLALSEGALPRHLHTSMFTISSDQRMLTNRQLSRHLVGLWTAEHPTALNLLKRILCARSVPYYNISLQFVHTADFAALGQLTGKPAGARPDYRGRWCAPTGLLAYLDSPDPVPEKDVDRMHVRDNVKIATDQYGRFNKVPEWQRLAGKAAKEVEKFAKEKVDLVLLHWRDRMGITQKENPNQKPVILRKRRQRIKIESNWELFYYRFQIDHARSNLIWNYKTREELRDALEGEMRAFNIDRELGSASVISWNHQEFEVKYECLSDEIKIGDYYLRLLLEEDESEETGAIKRSYEFFNELYHRFLLTPKVNMKCLCLQALAIVYGKCNEEIGPFTDTKYIVGMLDRSNVIEASPDMKRESEKEWYFGNADKERRGPFSFEEMQEFWKSNVLTPKTRCWAQGMDGWRPLQAIPQLKWCLLATGQAVLNETDLATLILNMLITMCSYFPSRDQENAIIRPLPRAKRLLSDNTCLPHIVQLLLTFDPILVEKVANVLHHIVQDNPHLPRMYLTGVFFFIMMYTGSNVLPIARFLKYTHLKQAFKSEEAKGQDIVQRSILGHILPEAMVCYLENYEPEKFSEIFLGEFDTPEAIWSSEMRRLMIEKIAAHLADFSPRLQSNTRALYQYCPIPSINYPQLDNELFCNIYYLKHLCDTQKFPDWPIKEPVKLLKDTLESWKKEVEKKPPSMSVDDAYEVLHLPKGQGQHDESKIRKAYFRLAQKYHPDKNPEGRDMFEKVNKAYEFLCTKSAKIVDGPDPENIILILKTQSILFNRHKEDLKPYKYAGYPMLIKTLTMETTDDQLFSKTSPLLPAAAELAFHTVNCSALNAEELRRENGIENIPRMATLAVECVSSFAVDYFLQTHMFHAGVLWHLLGYLFNYDYTLEESGIHKCEDTNQQEVANSLAKLSLVSLSRLGGYILEEDGPPENPTVRKSLAAMLTPYIASKLSKNTPPEVLKLLNSNTENPYLIWNNGTRAELLEFLETQQEGIIKRGDCDKSFGAEFVFSEHGKELIVGEIFVRVYNEQPTFPLEFPKAFAASLLDYIGSQAQYLHTLMAITQTGKVESDQHGERLRWVEMALEALRNVIKNNPGSETECMGHFKLIFSLLRVHGAGKVQQLSLEVVNIVTSNQECVSNIAESLVLSNLLPLLHSLPSSALIYLLDMFCNSTHPQVRSQTAELFAKMTSDKLIGPKVRLTLMKFLPGVFMDAMRDNSEAAVHIFEGTHENPELIWNDNSREKVSTTVREMMLDTQTQLADQVPPLGHLPKILQALNHKNNTIPKSSIRIIHALSDNEICVRAMASLETIGPLMTGMKVRSDMAGLACEALNRMFQKEQTDLVAQALRVELVPYLLRLLEGIGLETLDNPAATKAQIVKALKSMTRSLQYGEQVNEILSRSNVWSAFKDQKHDLFISESQTAGYLTGLRMSKMDRDPFFVKFVQNLEQSSDLATKAYDAIRELQSEEFLQTVDEEAALLLQQKDKSLYIFNSFSGPAFIHLKKEEVSSLVQLMGGRVFRDLNVSVTHLIAGEVGSKKYVVAANLGRPILLPSWVKACWEKSQDSSIEKRFCQDESMYMVEPTMDREQAPNTSTPTGCEKKQDVSSASLLLGVSQISNISMSCINESAFNTITASRLEPAGDNLEMLDISVFNAQDDLLDGCKIYLCGFGGKKLDKLRRLINSGGGLRFNQLSEDVTHIIMGEKDEEVNQFLSKASHRPHIVTVKWLLESFSKGCLLPEEKYFHSDYLPPAPSAVEPPVRKSAPQRRNTSVEMKTAVAVSPGREQRKDDDLLSQYMEEDKTVVEAGDRSCDDATRVTMLETEPSSNTMLEEAATVLEEGGLFSGKQFLIAGFSGEDEVCLAELIKEHAGKVLGARSRAIADYAVVPLLGCEVESTVGDVVTNTWLAMCIEQQILLDLQMNPMFSPVAVVEGSTPLKDCVLSVSQFTGVERDSLVYLAELLGARYTLPLHILLHELWSWHLFQTPRGGWKF
ncbi:UNVERIFIED_CONTAM: hypothetical protein FKN15_063892 [Acipenser sinensis]